MKKIILTLIILLSINLHATDKVKCEEIFRNAIYNFYLENSCKFDGHLAASMRKEFGEKNCTTLFSDEDMKKLNSEVLGESYQKMKKVGRDDFCKNNKFDYDELAKSYN